MLLQNKILAALICILFLQACGNIQPVYKENKKSGKAGSNIKEELQKIKVGNIDFGRPGQILENELKRKFNPSERNISDKYLLNINLTKNRRNVAVQKTREVLRYDIIVKANYRLIDKSDKNAEYSNIVEAVGSFDTGKSDYASYAAEEYAIEKVISELSEEIASDIILFFKRRRK